MWVKTRKNHGFAGMMTSKTIFAAALLALALVASGPARALPVLQLFIEGAPYDTES